jgi:hypothetical protein
MERKRRNRAPLSPRPQTREPSVDRQEVLAVSILSDYERANPLLRPVFQECCLSRNHSLALALMDRVNEKCMLGASPEVIEDTLGDWVCAIHSLLDDHARSVDFLARLLNLNLSLQEGRVYNRGLGYNALRSSHVWAPRPSVGPRRRVLGTMRTRALPRLQLRGGNNGNRAGFAGAVEEVKSAEVLAVVSSGEVPAVVEEVGAGADAEDGGEVLSAVEEVEEVSDAGLNDIMLAINAEDASTSVLKALEE